MHCICEFVDLHSAHTLPILIDANTNIISVIYFFTMVGEKRWGIA